MTDKEVLDKYIQLLPFLAEVLGVNCEIVVHDTLKPRKSIVAIANSISGRKIGDPMTDFALNVMKEGLYENADYATNYRGKGKGKDFLSSTYFIKNNDKIIGMLCVNKNITDINNTRNRILTLLDGFSLIGKESNDFSESLDVDVNEIAFHRIEEVIREKGISPSRMTSGEKVRLVNKLNEEGLLAFKGAKAKVAEILSISVPTIYRYLNLTKFDSSQTKK